MEFFSKKKKGYTLDFLQHFTQCNNGFGIPLGDPCPKMKQTNNTSS
jgi:hypothetical protein